MSRFHRLDASIDAALSNTPEPDPAAQAASPETPDEPEAEPVPDPETPEPEANKENTMADEKPLEEREDYQAGVAAGAKAERDRMSAVFAHQDCKGREAHAVRLLGRNMSSEDIIAELPNFPAAEALSEDQQREAAEEGGRQEMRDAMEAAGTKDLGADKGGDATGNTGRAKADARWDRANAAVGRTATKEG